MSEYAEASRGSPDTLVILVHSHKGSRPARVVVEEHMLTELEIWVTHLLHVEGLLNFCCYFNPNNNNNRTYTYVYAATCTCIKAQQDQVARPTRRMRTLLKAAT